MEEIRDEGRYYLHLKSGGLYRVIARGRLEATLVPAVIYECVRSSNVWVRPASEFDDGRFQVREELK
jgi:hypothetical protein